MPDPAPNKSAGAWPAAARLAARWLDRRERVDELFLALPPGLSTVERARCQHLVFGVVRHFGRIEAALGRLVSHPPRFETRAVLFLVGFELIEAASHPGESATAPAEGLPAKIVHHAVEQAKRLSSPAEARMVNAVARKLIPLMAEGPPPKLADAETLAGYFSHPPWLVKRWLVQLGADATRRLLEWNQEPAAAHARWRASAAKAVAPPEWLVPSQWPGFYGVPSGRWSAIEPLLKRGQLYLQDPGSRISVELLAPQRGETVLDVCAAPGGKSLLIVDSLRALAPAHSADSPGISAGRVVAVDVPGPRIDRLKENLSRVDGVDVALVQADLLEGGTRMFRDHGLPLEYSAVLIDVPCSNTGVMRHRVDVKWRLQEGDFRKHAVQQLSLLHAAARLVAPGGRIVYSTCSIDAEENERVINAFFESRAGGPFKLESGVISLPWESGHDGAAAFLLRRSTAKD